MFPTKSSKGQRLSQRMEFQTGTSTFCGLPLTLLFPQTSELHSREAISRNPANLSTERNNSIPYIFLTGPLLNSTNKALCLPLWVSVPFA